MKNIIKFCFLTAIFAIAMFSCRKEKDPTLTATPSSLVFSAAGESKTFDVQSNVEWTIRGEALWLTVTPTKGKGNATVTVEAKANTVLAIRSVELSISGKDVETVTVDVSQAAGELTTVTIAAINGVTPPVAGATPATAITEAAQYTGAVTWSPLIDAGGAFAYGTAYTATITLTAKAGFTFAGVAANFFTVAGATPSNAANSGVVTAAFPATEGLIMIGAQTGMLKVTGGSATFQITTAGIAANAAPAAAWYSNVAGTTATTAPAGVSLSLPTGGSPRTLTMTTTTATPAGIYYFRLTMENTTSDVATLTVTAPNGTEGNPYLVASVADLRKVGSGADGWELNSHYRQTADIDLKDVANWTPIGIFAGSYDGGGFSIAGLKISATSNYQGLFRQIDGAVRNIALINANISTSSTYVGGIAGYNKGTIENCYVTGAIAGNSYVGGVSGNISMSSEVKNCYSTCDVTTGSNGTFGGIVGTNNGGAISYCYATGKVSGVGAGGGIVGENYGSVENCVALNAEVVVNTGFTVYIGRVAGYLHNSGSASMSRNYARSGMTLTSNGSTVTPVNSATGIHGANATPTNTHQSSSSLTWWNSETNANGPGFLPDSWSFGASRLPHLKTTEGVVFPGQNPTVE